MRERELDADEEVKMREERLERIYLFLLLSGISCELETGEQEIMYGIESVTSEILSENYGKNRE